MWPNNRLIDLLGIEFPIVQAPMAGAMDWELAAAAAEAGALGSLPCAMLNADQVREQMGKIRARTRKPINLNFFCHTPPVLNNEREARWRETLAPYYRELGIDPAAPVPSSNRAAFDSAFCDVVEEIKPEVVSFHFGLPEPGLLKRVKAAGAVVLSSATTAAEARWLEARGADVIIAQGYEAGGHRGMFLTDDIAAQVGTFALMPQVVDAVKVPVIAAGGITDARGIAAAFALGAAGAQIGSAYLWSPEAKISAPHRAALDGVPERRHRADQSDDRAAGPRHRQPGNARDRADLGRGARVSARRRRAGAAARQGRGAGLGRFLADVGGAGGLARARAAGGRAHPKACRRGARAHARARRRRIAGVKTHVPEKWEPVFRIRTCAMNKGRSIASRIRDAL